MRRFVVRTLIFLLPLIILAVGCELYTQSLPNSYRLKDSWLRQNGGRVETLVLGNSHAYYGIMPSLLGSNAFNAANVSQVAAYDLAILQHYTPLCPKLKNVVMVVDNSYLFDLPLEQTEPARCTYYNMYMNIGPHCRWGKYGFEILQFDETCKKLQAYHNGTYPVCDSLGWGTDFKASLSTFDPTDSDFLDRVIKQHTCKDWNWAEYNIEKVEAIAQFCNQHSIKLTIIQTPVCEAYHQRVPVRQQQTIDELMRKLQSQYGTNCIDFSADTRFCDSDFYDADHLSDIGAGKFTKILKDTLF